MNEVVILSRMYAGGYLQDKIGHEVINLFRADNGGNYIYINEDGRINPQYNDSVRAVLLVKYVEPGVMEVIAKAEGLKQILYKTGDVQEESSNQVSYVDNNHITYGGVPLYKVYTDGTIDDRIVITFQVEKLRKVKKPFYLIEDAQKVFAYDSFCHLPERHFSKQRLKMYYPKESFPQDYRLLEDTINNEAIWEANNTTEKLDVNNDGGWQRHSSFLSIIKKEYDELVFSNMLAYFFEQNRQVFVEFTRDVLKIESFSKQFKIIRESKYNIDLWIEDENTVIIIENKIKSKINGVSHDIYGEKIQSQLSKYYREAKKECRDKEIHCFIFSPDYNSINLEKYESGDYYKIVKYSQIYDFYMKYAGRMLHTSYFCEFVDAISLHSSTIDNSNFEIMKSRFISAISRIKDNA